MSYNPSSRTGYEAEGSRSAVEVRDPAEQFADRVPPGFWQELREAKLLPADASVPAQEPS